MTPRQVLITLLDQGAIQAADQNVLQQIMAQTKGQPAAVPVPRPIAKDKQLDLLTRSVDVFGRMLDRLSVRHSLLKSPSTWLIRLGRVLWAAVELATPGSLPGKIGRHWHGLLLLFALLMIALGIGLTDDQVRAVGVQLLLFLLALGLLVWILQDWLRSAPTPWLIVAWISLALLLLLALFCWVVFTRSDDLLRPGALTDLDRLFRQWVVIPAACGILPLVLACVAYRVFNPRHVMGRVAVLFLALVSSLLLYQCTG